MSQDISDFASVLNAHSSDTNNSFGDDLEKNGEIDEARLAFAEFSIGMNDSDIRLIKKLLERTFTIVVKNYSAIHFKAHKNPGTSESSTTDENSYLFQSYIVQTGKSLFLLVKTDFNIFDKVSLEPNSLEESFGTFHTELKTNLGLKNASAFDGFEIDGKSDKESDVVAVIKNTFRLIDFNKKSFILFDL